MNVSTPFRVIPYYGGEGRIYRDVEFKVTNVHRNKENVNKSENIKIRCCGGALVDRKEKLVIKTDEMMTDGISKGEDLLLFLVKSTGKDDYDTSKEYFYILGDEQGLYNKADTNFINTLEKDRIITIDELNDANSYPFENHTKNNIETDKKYRPATIREGEEYKDNE